MTASVTDRVTHAQGLSFARVCRSEWTKFRSIRSTWWLLILSVLLIVGIGLVGTVQDARHAGDDRYYRHPGPVELAQNSQFGAYVAVLVVLVLAAVFVTGEYGTGMIRSSLTVVPRRTTVLLGKSVVLLGVVAGSSAVSAVLVFLGTGAVWSAHDRVGASFADPGVPSVVLGVPLFCSLAAVFALAVGTLVRNTAGALAILLGLFFVVPAMLASQDYASYLPSNAGGAMSRLGFGQELSGGTAMMLFGGYAVVLLVLAAGRLRRSDV